MQPDDDIDRAAHLMRPKALRRLPAVEVGVAVGAAALGDLAVERDFDSALGNISAADPNAWRPKKTHAGPHTGQVG